MTVENSVSKTPKLVMGAKTYDFNFDVLLEDPTAEEAKRAIKCSISNGTEETELIYGTDYTVTLNSDKKGGVVTVTDVKDDRWHIVIYRQYNMTQGVDLNDYNEFPAETIERAFDKQTMLIQELKEIAERSVKVTPANNQTPEELLDEVYSKLDSATEVATNAIAAATLATTAAESATKAVEDANQQVAEVTKYIDDKKVEIDGIVVDAQNSVDGAITQATEDVKTAATEAAEAIIQDAGQTATNIAVDYVNTTVKPELQGISDNAQQYATNAKASQEAAKVSETNAKTSENIAKTAEANTKANADKVDRYINLLEGALGDIGFSAFGIDETKNLRRYLNGQVISQAQFAKFAELIKNRAELYPSIVTTEENWQSEVNLSQLGQCGKFVIDDEAGTIRLPKIIMPIQGLTDLSKLGEIVEAGLPNITGSQATVQNTTRTANGALDDSSHILGFSVGGSTKVYAGTTILDASKSNPIYGKSSTVQQEQIQYPYFIQVATGNEEQADITTEIQLNNPFSLLEPKWSDKLLTNASWLRSNGQGNSGTVYTDAYNLILSEYNSGVDTTETVGGVTITYRRGTTTNMKITTDKTAYDNILLATGTAWYFVLDTVNTLFYLPQTNGFFQFGGEGDYVEAGLPNITANWSNQKNGVYGDNEVYNGAIYPQKGSAIGAGDGSSGINTIWNFNASRSSSIYGKSSTVQPNAVKGYLYFYVGETIQDANVIATSGVLTRVAELSDSYISGLGMPSDRYIDLTLGASGSTYTAPANGYVSFRGNTSGSNGYVTLTASVIMTGYDSRSGVGVRAFVPVRKGQTFGIAYNAINTNSGSYSLSFHYAEGETE